MNWLDVITATYNPKRTDDLTASARAFIGTSGEWSVAWEIESGPYKGQWALQWHEAGDKVPPGWVPECDLDIVGDSL